METNLTIQEICEPKQWQLARQPWIDFLEESKITDPFLSYEWFECCLQACQNKKKLFVLFVKEHAKILGIAPFWSYQDSIRYIPVTRLGFISCPDTPHVDLIVLDRRRIEVLKVIVNHLFITRRHVWDIWTLRQWSTNSKNYVALQQTLSPQTKSFSSKTASQTPYILLEPSWETFLQSRSIRFRKTRRNIANKFSKLGNTEIQCVQYDHNGKYLNEAFTISKKSWKFQDGLALVSSDHTRQFFESLTKVAGEKHWLLLWLLRINEVPVAMEYDLVSDGKVYALRADYDEAYAEMSPGTYLESEILQRLFQESQFKVYYTGPGMNPYKLHSTESIITNVTLNIFNSNLRGRAVNCLENYIVPFFRSFRNRIGGIRQKEK